MNKRILIVHNYFGPRRVFLQEYDDDPLFYAKKQIEFLTKIKHCLTHIVFTVNIRDGNDIAYIHELSKIFPKRIQNASTEIYVRKNVGLSYGAFSDVYKKYRKSYDFYFFTEDDYVFCENWFDSTMVGMLLENERPGYLCAAVRNDFFKIHAGNSVGVGHVNALEEVFEEDEKIPHLDSHGGYELDKEGEQSQIVHTNSIYEKGYSLTDIGRRYTLYHVWPDRYEHFFPENTKEIISPIQRLI